MLWSIDSCQTEYPLTSITWPYAGSGVQVTSFQMIAGSNLIFLIHMKYVVFYMCQTIKILISNYLDS